MAYAREGEFDSDVYVYRGHSFICLGGYHEMGMYEANTEQDMINHLWFHREQGDTVPERALERLAAERDGVPWETDVERALRELKEEGWPNG